MTYHPTTMFELKAAIEDPDGPPIVDCDYLKESYLDGTAAIAPVTVADRDLEVNFRELNLWTNAVGADAALTFLGGPAASPTGFRPLNGKWSTNADRGARIRNATGFRAEHLEFSGCKIGWNFGSTEDGQCEQIELDGCGGTRIKFDALLFDPATSYNAARIEAFKFHHHQNPDDGETAYAMRVLGNLYGSKIDIYGWQDDKEDDAGLTGGNKGIKVHSSGSVGKSDVHFDAENGGSYLMKIEFPAISFPWELPENDRRLQALDFDRISLSGTWPYAYGLILDGGPTAPELWPSGTSIEDWIDPSRVTVTGGHFTEIGKEKNRLVAIEDDGGILYPAGVS